MIDVWLTGSITPDTSNWIHLFCLDVTYHVTDSVTCVFRQEAAEMVPQSAMVTPQTRSRPSGHPASRGTAAPTPLAIRAGPSVPVPGSRTSDKENRPPAEMRRLKRPQGSPELRSHCEPDCPSTKRVRLL